MPGDITLVVPPPHKKYYLPGGDLYIIAGKTLFRVHGYFFSRDSPIFNSKLNPVSPGQTREGTTNTEPVVLDGVTAEEFERLLWVFYNPKYSLYDASVETWKSVLRLANKLEFKEVKELAIRELHLKKELPLVDKMALYQAHQVDQRHLVPLFAELCARDTPLTLEESHILGPDSTYLVYSTRERLRAQPSDEGRSPLPEGLEETDVFRALESFFGMDHGSTLAFQQENKTDTLSNGNPSLRASRTSSTRGTRLGTPKNKRP